MGFVIQTGFFSARQLQVCRCWLQGRCSASCSAGGNPLLVCQHWHFGQGVSLCAGKTWNLEQPGEKVTCGCFQRLKFSAFLPREAGACCQPGCVWAAASPSDGALPSCCGAQKAHSSTPAWYQQSAEVSGAMKTHSKQKIHPSAAPLYSSSSALRLIC